MCSSDLVQQVEEAVGDLPQAEVFLDAGSAALVVPGGVQRTGQVAAGTEGAGWHRVFSFSLLAGWRPLPRSAEIKTAPDVRQGRKDFHGTTLICPMGTSHVIR